MLRLTGIVTEIVSALVLVILAGHALFGGWQIGANNDDRIHQLRTGQWLENGWYLLPRYFENGSINPDVETGLLHMYGAGYSVFGHLIAVLTGAEEWGTTAYTAAVYSARHLAMALLGVAAALAVGYALFVLTRRRMIGIWAVAATVALPPWTGYSMFAVKGVPAAAGWTFITTAMIVALVPKPGRLRPIAVALLSFAGMWFSVGVRTALWVPLAVSAAAFTVLVVCSPVRRQLTANVTAVAAGLLAGFGAVAALHYRNAATPVEWLLSSVRTSGDFEWTGLILTAGQLVSEKPPWWYLPAWVGASVPLLLGLLSVAGIALLARVLVRRPSRTTEEASDANHGVWSRVVGGVRARLGHRYAGMLLWIEQALMLPLVAIVGGATMYSGMRQHLYVLPALAALAGFAAHLITRRFNRGWGGVAVAAILLVAIVVPAWEQARLFPYNYVYKNEVAGSVNDRWETDMAWISSREAISRVPPNETAWCYHGVTRRETGEPSVPTIWRCADHGQLQPYLSEQGSSATPVDDTAQVWVIARPIRGNPPAPGCREHDSVVRPLRGEDVIVSYVLLCATSVLTEQ